MRYLSQNTEKGFCQNYDKYYLDIENKLITKL